MSVSYGTYTLTEVQEGSQIWTTTVAPTAPDYTFTISNLSGDSQTSIKVGDIILYSFYRYTVSSINDNGTTVLTGNRTSIRGASGADSTTYILIISNSVITKDKNSNYSPTSITLTSKYQTGANVMTNYYGRFKIETTIDNETWTTVYTSNTNESTKTYSIPTNIVAVRCGLYLANGTTTLLDQQTIPIISDGVDGNDGEDAYTIILTNENHTFAGDTTSALASEIQCNIIGYKGATQMATTIGTITGQPTGMTTTVSNNGTTNASFTVSVTTSMVTKNGVLTIPITIDGKSFDKEFSYSLALNGQDGKDGGRWYSGTNITGTSTTATVFSDSGISSAVIGDMYLNTSTYNTYRCTVAGSASVAKWVYVNNIKGQIGDTGKGISSIVNQYILTTTVPSSTDSNWSTTVPNYETGKYYWTKSHITWTDGTETDTTPVLDNGITSANSNAEDAKTIANSKADANLAIAEEQYIYITKTGVMAFDGTTTWVTEIGDVQNIWTTKPPTYNSDYPVLYVAKQKKTVNGTVTCTTPLKDDTTTVIDGGRIITGSIDANKIATNTLQVSMITGLQTELDGKATSADLTNATGWNVIITYTSLDFINNTTTLSATVYKDGTVQTTGFTLKWYKDNTLISGENSSTLAVTDLDASYTCVVD